jgi:hypothetical protein
MGAQAKREHRKKRVRRVMNLLFLGQIGEAGIRVRFFRFSFFLPVLLL